MSQTVIKLGRATGVRATFGPEGIAATFGKLFKTEIQTGDALFDEHVHVKTDTEEATTTLLENTDIRTVIERIVSEGGAVEIENNEVHIELGDGIELDQALVRALVDAVGK